MAQQNESQKLIEQALTDPGKVEPMQLVANLIQANYNEYAAVTQAVIDGQKREIAQLKATLSVIRLRINELFTAGYMPTQDAIERAVFFPSPKRIQQFVEHLLRDPETW